MGPTWGPSGSCRPQMGPMLAPWTLLSGPSSVGCRVAMEPSQTNPVAKAKYVFLVLTKSGRYYKYDSQVRLSWIVWISGSSEGHNTQCKYISIDMHTVHASLVLFGSAPLIPPYTFGLLYQKWVNLMIIPVPVKQPWMIWVNESPGENTYRNSERYHNETNYSKTLCIFTALI